LASRSERAFGFVGSAFAPARIGSMVAAVSVR